MYIRLSEAQLKSGERMEIGVVEAPDPEWRDRLVPFLGHKGPDWLPQIELALSQPLDNLQTRFYVGRVGNRMICQTMTTGNRSSAILGHVFTAPEERQRGAIRALLETLMEDSHARFQWMTLGSEYGSPAHLLYRSLGFESVVPGSGDMVWSADGSWSFPPAPETCAAVRPTRWEDWSAWSLLALQPVTGGENLPRSPQLGLYGQQGLEFEFMQLQLRRMRDKKVQAVTLISDKDIALGWAFLSPSDADRWKLDLHAHSAACEQFPNLLGGLDLPNAPISCLVRSEAPNDVKFSALKTAGFVPNAEPEIWIDSRGTAHELMRMVRAS